MKFWLQGPEWLSSNNVVWPTSDLLCLNSVNKSIVLNTEIGSIAKEILPLVSFEKYSKFSKLVGVTAKVIEALNKFKVLKSNKMQKLWDTTDPHQCAKIHVLKVMQKQSFPSEIDFILDPRNKKPPDLVNNLNLFIDRTGLMRSNGRIGKNKYFEYEVINPVLLAKDHLLTRRIIEEAHLQVKHLGIQATLNNVRLAGFWLTHPYQSVKNVINPCVICQKFNALSYRYPKVTNLPKHRVNFVRPYLHVGVDFTGHIMVREGKTEKKMYLLLFTCLNIRSVHMELLPDMTTGQFVMAIIRFTNEHGIPSHIYSDNAKSFLMGVNHVSTVLASSEFSEHFSLFNIKHITIPLYAPWIGATWERMIKTVKTCLQKQ
ncbi:unnamed protein product [Meganyctiphanes norvegica]|uniref:Integrase catalytic domain-containing protein n=1 Tax=Meganyctiphanes norvegica TaxID=48144 RepID=A0AAV2QHK5_MEGNR